MEFLTVFYSPMVFLIERPYLALVPALILGFAYRASSTPQTGALWVLYALYEGYMYFWSKTVIVPIRVDLLLLTPVLYLVSLAGILGWWRSTRAYWFAVRKR